MSATQEKGVDGESAVDVGPLEEIPEGKFRILDLAGRSIGVVRNGETVHAVRNICPHRTAPICQGMISGTMMPSDPGELRFGLEGEVLQCPWHGWEFSLLTGEALFTGVRNRLRLYRTEIRDGRVFVHLHGRPPRGEPAGKEG
jgi:nitrite reductase/ring-hydroxylating ferredoxin subunit